MRTLQTHDFTQLHRERDSPACLAIGTVAGVSFVRPVISPPIFLEPFAPPELPGFLATMVPLTPVSLLSGRKQVSLLHESELPSIPSPNTPSPPRIAFTRYPSASQGIPSSGLGFAITPQARQSIRPNRVHFCYGLDFRCLVFPTPPHDDAVPVRYRPENVYLKRTYTFLF